jgi:hypothetical protein
MDPYCSARTRRFSQYRACYADGVWAYHLLPPRAHIQQVEHNKAVGGMMRAFEPIKVDVGVLLDYVIDAFQLQEHRHWHVDLHQWRMRCAVDSAVESVPEGAHRDGHQMVGIFVIERSNIKGGRTLLYDPTGRPVFDDVLGPGEGIVFDDRKFLHDTSAIIADEQGGYRDIFAICVNDWENRRYGASFEAVCQADN